MAFVTHLTKVVPDAGGRRHSETTASWHAAERDGEPVLQIDTYGSPDRQDAGTKSQSLQLDAARAQELVDAIREVFPSVR